MSKSSRKSTTAQLTLATEETAVTTETTTATVTEETAVTETKKAATMKKVVKKMQAAEKAAKAEKATAPAIPQHLATAALLSLKLADIEVVTDRAAIDFDPRLDLPVAPYLVASMQARGFDAAHPVIVWRTPAGTLRKLGGLQRIKAAKAAGLTEVVGIIDPTVTNEREALLAQVRDNGQRQDDDVATQLANAQRLDAQGFSAAAIADALGLAAESAAAALLKVSRKATPALIAAIEAGLVEQTSALILAQQPAPVQAAAVADLKAEAEKAAATGDLSAGSESQKAQFTPAKGKPAKAGPKLTASKSLVRRAIEKAKNGGEKPAAPAGPRTGKPAADEVAAVRTRLQTAAIDPSLSKEERHVASGMAALLAFLDSGTMPSPGFVATYASVTAAFKAMR
jgi:ParB-like chromosome segregation protein Spo0J